VGLPVWKLVNFTTGASGVFQIQAIVLSGTPERNQSVIDELNKSQSESNRDAGIAHAVGGAEIKHPKWARVALGYIYKYPFDQFMTEELRLWSHAEGLEHPPNSRAWGGVIRKAVSKGIIKRVGFRNVKNPKAHATVASVWEKI
jgi:hypothetical protein